MVDIKLIQGDCLEKMKDIPDGSIDAIITDPPYGTTVCKWDNVIPFKPMWEQLRRVIKPNGVIVMTASQPFTSVLVMSNMKMFRYCLVWDKVKGTGYLNAKKQPMRNHEDIVIFYKSPPTYNPQKTYGHSRKVSFRSKSLQTDVYGKPSKDCLYDSTERYPRSIIVCSTDTQNSSLHPTQKPVALMEYLIKTYTNEGETILDFAMGSGPTGVACINTNRNFIGIELDKGYFEIARERLEDFMAQGKLFE